MTRRRRWALGVLLLGGAAARAQNITGAGATSPTPLYARWFYEYNKLHPEVRINYQPVGSGAGIRQVSERVVDFGASDLPMTDEQMAEAQVKILPIPTVLGAVVPVYHLPGQGIGPAPSLRLAPDVLAGIYLGQITRWNDARLQRDNPGVALPDHAILVVYRSDGAGTTYVFTDYLAKVSAAFASQVGRNSSVRWPVGVGGRGSDGVAALVRDSPYSIGYIELVYATEEHLSVGVVRNRAGEWVGASIAALRAAAMNPAPGVGADLRASITDSARTGAYPIASFTWLLVPQRAADAAKGRALVGFLRWMFTDGELEAAAMNCAPLPEDVASLARQVLLQLQ